jgi:hypothetical protein
MVQIEHDFTLPVGLLGEDGSLHREGTMRLATAADEILPLQDPRVQRNPSYLTVILLSRVVTRLDGIEPITPKSIESLFAADLAFLQDLYNRVNDLEDASDRTIAVCPSCGEEFATGPERLGEPVRIPSIS